MQRFNYIQYVIQQQSQGRSTGLCSGICAAGQGQGLIEASCHRYSFVTYFSVSGEVCERCLLIKAGRLHFSAVSGN